MANEGRFAGGLAQGLVSGFNTVNQARGRQATSQQNQQRIELLREQFTAGRKDKAIANFNASMNEMFSIVEKAQTPEAKRRALEIIEKRLSQPVTLRSGEQGTFLQLLALPTQSPGLISGTLARIKALRQSIVTGKEVGTAEGEKEKARVKATVGIAGTKANALAARANAARASAAKSRKGKDSKFNPAQITALRAHQTADRNLGSLIKLLQDPKLTRISPADRAKISQRWDAIVLAISQAKNRGANLTGVEVEKVSSSMGGDPNSFFNMATVNRARAIELLKNARQENKADFDNFKGIIRSGRADIGGTLPDGTIINNPQTGERRRLENGRWVPVK